MPTANKLWSTLLPILMDESSAAFVKASEGIPDHIFRIGTCSQPMKNMKQQRIREEFIYKHLKCWVSVHVCLLCVCDFCPKKEIDGIQYMKNRQRGSCASIRYLTPGSHDTSPSFPPSKCTAAASTMCVSNTVNKSTWPPVQIFGSKLLTGPCSAVGTLQSFSY